MKLLRDLIKIAVISAIISTVVYFRSQKATYDEQQLEDEANEECAMRCNGPYTASLVKSWGKIKGYLCRCL